MIKSISELLKFVKREKKDAKEYSELARTSADKNFYEGKEIAYKDILIQLELLKEVIDKELNVNIEKGKKKTLLIFLLGTIFGGSLLTILTYIIIAITQ